MLAVVAFGKCKLAARYLGQHYRVEISALHSKCTAFRHTNRSTA